MKSLVLHCIDLSRKYALQIAILITLTILYLSISSGASIPMGEFKHVDKLKHCLAYGTLAYVWKRNFRDLKLAQQFSLVFSIISFGILMEVLQMTLTENRQGDILDVLANSIGVCMGIFIYKLSHKK